MKTKLPGIAMATYYLLFGILLVYVIIVAKNFLYPIALATLFAYLLFPIANFLENKLRFPRILAILFTLLSAMFLVGVGFKVVYMQLEIMISDLPAIKAQTMKNIEAIESFVASRFGIAESNQKIWIKQSIGNFFDNSNRMFGQIFSATTGTILRIGLMPVFVFFMLYYRDKVRAFVFRVSSDKNQRVVKKILLHISRITQHYMGGVSIVVLILCVVNSTTLWLIGLEYAIVFGIIAAVCNFIPYFGTIIGFSFPLFFALITQDSPSVIIGVIITFFAVQFTENNILTPNIVGDHVRLNPFIIILSLIAGAMVWGIPGMLVIVPLMAVLRIIFENIENLKPYAFLLGTEGTEEHSVTFAKVKSLFRRKK